MAADEAPKAEAHVPDRFACRARRMPVLRGVRSVLRFRDPEPRQVHLRRGIHSPTSCLPTANLLCWHRTSHAGGAASGERPIAGLGGTLFPGSERPGRKCFPNRNRGLPRRPDEGPVDKAPPEVENAFMELGVVALVAVVAVVYFAGRDAADATQTAFEGFFRGHRADPWPHGVQEQDIARHWDDRGERASGSGSHRRADPSDGHVWVEQDQAEVRTLMRPPSLRIVPVRDYRVESHI
jgi:hypothetical protein